MEIMGVPCCLPEPTGTTTPWQAADPLALVSPPGVVLENLNTLTHAVYS